MFVKALDLPFFGAARCLSSAQSTSYYGVMGHVPPRKFSKKNNQNCCFQHLRKQSISFPGKALSVNSCITLQSDTTEISLSLKSFKQKCVSSANHFHSAQTHFDMKHYVVIKEKGALEMAQYCTFNELVWIVVRNEWKKLPSKAILCVAHNCNMCQNDSVRITIMVHVQVNSIAIKCTPSLLILPQAVHLS